METGNHAVFGVPARAKRTAKNAVINAAGGGGGLWTAFGYCLWTTNN
jgi:hypothetical protein